MARFVLALIVFVVFTTYSLGIVADEGALAVLDLLRGGWSQQVFIDLFIACGFVTLWVLPDAKKHGISPWPFIVALPLVGSISTLAYLVLREWKRMRVPPLVNA